MKTKNKMLQRFRPSVPKRYLIFIAAIVWTIAGSILLVKGTAEMLELSARIWPEMIGAVAAGLCFYMMLFSNISVKHTRRMVNLPNDRPYFFSFFNLKSYLIMAVMISGGIALRKSEMIPPLFMAIIQLTMGIPLFLSALRFYYFGIFYPNTLKRFKSEPTDNIR